jgi:hypothetical protein
VDGLGIPASENLHTCRLTQCSEHRHWHELSFPYNHSL